MLSCHQPLQPLVYLTHASTSRFAGLSNQLAHAHHVALAAQLPFLDINWILNKPYQHDLLTECCIAPTLTVQNYSYLVSMNYCNCMLEVSVLLHKLLLQQDTPFYAAFINCTLWYDSTIRYYPKQGAYTPARWQPY